MTTAVPERSLVGPGAGAKAGSPQESRLLSEVPQAASPGPGTGYVQEGVLHCGLPPAEDVRLVGYGKLRKLLAPAHEYFKDKAGYIESWDVLRDTGNEKRLAYPRVRPVRSGSRNNPYRRHRSRQREAARTFRRLEGLVASYGLASFPVLEFTPTMPKSMSKWLAGLGKKGREKAWGLWGRYWREDVEPLLLGDRKGAECLAARVNLHTWSSSNPLEAHVHFHGLISLLSRYKPGLDGVGPAPDLRHLKWGKVNVSDGEEGVKKSTVPISPEVLEELKVRWKARLMALARRNGQPTSELNNEKRVNIHTNFVTYRPGNDKSRARLLHKIGYGSRMPLEDYAEYVSDHPDAPMPPSWLDGYENKSRKFGWWERIGEMTAWRNPERVQEKKATRESVETGAPLLALRSRLSTLELVSSGPLAGQDLVIGMVEEHSLGTQDVSWLLEHSIPLAASSEFSSDNGRDGPAKVPVGVFR